MRKEKRITIDDRGNELTFVIREMPALKLEKWIIRAGLALASSGLAKELLAKNDAPDAADVVKAGFALGKMETGKLLSALGRIDYDKAEPLLNELLECCSLVSGNQIVKMTPDEADGVISDVRTLFALQKEAIKINFGFFGDAGQSGTGREKETQDNPTSPRPRISVR